MVPGSWIDGRHVHSPAQLAKTCPPPQKQYMKVMVMVSWKMKLFQGPWRIVQKKFLLYWWCEILFPRIVTIRDKERYSKKKFSFGHCKNKGLGAKSRGHFFEIVPKVDIYWLKSINVCMFFGYLKHHQSYHHHHLLWVQRSKRWNILVGKGKRDIVWWIRELWGEAVTGF